MGRDEAGESVEAEVQRCEECEVSKMRMNGASEIKTGEVEDCDPLLRTTGNTNPAANGGGGCDGPVCC